MASPTVAVIDPSLFTIPYDTALCGGLLAAGWTPTLYGRALRAFESATVPIEPFFYRYSERLRRLKALFRVAKGVEHFRDMGRLCRRLAGDPPDAIHFQWLPLPIIDQRFIGKFRAIAPVILTVHDITPFNAAGSRVQKIGALDILHAFDHLIVHTESSRRTLEQRGLPADRISVVPHGILPNSRSTAEVIKSSQTTILLFGRLQPYKGLDVLIDAFAQVPERLRARSRLLVVGSPTFDIEPLKQKAAKEALNITWDLRFIPESEVDLIMRQADIFVFPYHEIDASGVFMSCLRYGKPIVASRLGAFAALLEDGVHGHLVPPNHVTALAEALADLLADPFACERYGANVMRVNDAVPSWEAIGQQTVAIYRAVSRVTSQIR